MRKRKINIMMDILFLGIIAAIIGISVVSREKEQETEGIKYDFQILEKEHEVSALYYDGSKVYVGTEKGIHIYDSETRKLLQEIDNIRTIYTAAIISDGDDGIWVGHEEGLTHIDRNGNQTNLVYPDIPEGRVNTVAEKDGVIYCGTYNGAAEIINENENWKVVRTFTAEDGLLCDSVNVILPVRDGILFGSYLDTEGGITFLSDSGEVSCLDAALGIPHPYITSAIEEEDGDVLLGTGYMRDGALVRLSRYATGYQVDEIYSVKDGIPGEKIRFLFEDERSLWITTEYDGVLVKRKEQGKDWMTGRNIYLTKDSGLSDNEIKCIVKAKDSYWLGGKYGLTVVPENSME